MKKEIYLGLKLTFFCLSLASAICVVQWIWFGIIYNNNGKWLVSYNNFGEMYSEFILFVFIGVIDFINYLKKSYYL